jgi:N-acetylglucosamine-6-phosphate deacetylase
MTTYEGRIVTPTGVVDGVLTTDGTVIAAVEPGPIAADAPWIVPGFVDMHVHGGGGHAMTTGSADAVRGAVEFHLGHGTTTMVASLVSSPFEVMYDATVAYAPLVAAGDIAGIHFEGPYLSEACCGAQNPDFLRAPSTSELEALAAAVDPSVIRMMTIAPELPEALDAIAFLASRDIVAAIGHTDATYQQVLDGVAAGATVGTHVFNGMRPPHHRAPGPVYALLGAAGVICEFVADGVHLADDTIRFATGVVGVDRAALITDAIDATGMADGAYNLGGQDVTVTGGVARLVTNDGSEGAIAGSTLTMDSAFRRVLRINGSIVDATRMASTNPARALGLTDRGALMPGLRADFLLLDQENHSITAVVRGGAAR